MRGFILHSILSVCLYALLFVDFVGCVVWMVWCSPPSDDELGPGAQVARGWILRVAATTRYCEVRAHPSIVLAAWRCYFRLFVDLD